MACGNPFLYLKISALSGHVRRIAYWCPHRPTNKTGFLLIFMKNIYPEYPCFPQDFISSFPCRKMGLEVFGFYNWFLMHSWVYSEKPCHLPTDISDLKIVFNVDEQLINNCITILFDLGKILKTEDKKYYYNPRLLCEYKKLQKRSKIYSENRKCRDRKGMKNKVKQQLLNNSSTILLQADNDNDSDNDSGSESEKKKADLSSLPAFAVELTDILISHVTSLNPSAKNITSQLNETRFNWATGFDRIHRLDGKNPDEMRRVLYYAMRDSFWRTNILSADKFRKQYDTLFIKHKGSQSTARGL